MKQRNAWGLEFHVRPLREGIESLLQQLEPEVRGSTERRLVPGTSQQAGESKADAQGQDL